MKNAGVLLAVAMLLSTLTFSCGSVSDDGGGYIISSPSSTPSPPSPPSPPVLQTILVTPASPQLGVGAAQQFTATGIYSTGSSTDLTSSVTWTSYTVSVAAVSNAVGSEGLVTTLMTGTSLITAGDPATNITGSTTLTVVANQLMGGAIQGPSLTLSAIVTTIAGTHGWNAYVDDIGSAARFAWPTSLTTDGTVLYISDSENGAIRQMDIATKAVTTFVSIPQSAGITTDGTSLFVTNPIRHIIQQIDIASKVVSTLTGSLDVPGSIDGIGTNALFNLPNEITTDGTNLYVTDSDNHTIRMVEISSGLVSTICGSAGVAGFADGPGSAARFDSPYGITTDGTSLFVNDVNNFRVRQIDIATKSVTTLAGSLFGYIDGTGSDAQFWWLSGITTDGTYLYVEDASRIRRINIATGGVLSIAGNPAIWNVKDGTGTDAWFLDPTGITTDGVRLYVTEWQDSTIREIR